MKIRSDFVSNSSSSSYIVLGAKLDGTRLDPSSGESIFDGLKENETIILIVKGAGNEGDYIFNFSLDFLMDCHLHMIDIENYEGDQLIFIKTSTVMYSYGSIYDGKHIGNELDGADDDGVDENTRRSLSTDGIPIDPQYRLFRFWKDENNPTLRETQLDEVRRCVERAARMKNKKKNEKNRKGGKK